LNIIKWDGQAITRPGCYSGVSMSRYHGPNLTLGASVSRSGLWKVFDDSPAHYWLTSPYNPEYEPPGETEALVIGRAAHHLLMGEPNFRQHFAIRPEEWSDWRTKDAKAWRSARQDEGLSVLEPKHLDAIRGMAGGLNAHPLVRAGLLNGLIEHTLVAQDPETGIWLKVRPDAIPTDGSDVSDLKTCVDISDDGLETAIGRDGLFMQGALIAYVYRLLGMEMRSFTLCFVEKAAPFCVRTKTLTTSDLALGEDAVVAALRTFRKCMDRNVWPGPGGEQTDAEYISIKPYHRKRFEDRIQFMENDL